MTRYRPRTLKHERKPAYPRVSVPSKAKLDRWQVRFRCNVRAGESEGESEGEGEGEKANVHNGAQFNSSATCIPCADRMKEIISNFSRKNWRQRVEGFGYNARQVVRASKRRRNGKTASAIKRTNVHNGAQFNRPQVRSNKEWFELVKAIRDGEDNKLADLKEHVIEMKQRFPNMVDWDQEIFCIAAAEVATRFAHQLGTREWRLKEGDQ